MFLYDGYNHKIMQKMESLEKVIQAVNLQELSRLEIAGREVMRQRASPKDIYQYEVDNMLFLEIYLNYSFNRHLKINDIMYNVYLMSDFQLMRVLLGQIKQERSSSTFKEELLDRMSEATDRICGKAKKSATEEIIEKTPILEEATLIFDSDISGFLKCGTAVPCYCKEEENFECQMSDIKALRYSNYIFYLDEHFDESVWICLDAINPDKVPQVEL